MYYEIDLNTKKSISEDELRKQLDDIRFFCNTPKGSLPQNRDFGLDHSILDEPFPVLRMKATVNIVTGLRKFFGINVLEINLSADENGKITAKISI